MDKHVNDIRKALLLRDPQLYSLEILAWVADNILLTKDADVDVALQKISGKHSTVTDFERDFPSLCFALATGVGKTRLMGAAIAYLYVAKGMKNFFVLAPNLTIYNKLITDFDYKSPKYVFKGVEEFAVRRPEIIRADNYENRGEMFAHEDDIRINIFNISKITEKEKGSKKLLIKKTREVLGSSYFKKLAEQDDLVLLMDEAHRYRASAGMSAINELKPVLGIELTATPQVERGTKTVLFKNVIYDYDLSKAMRGGFVKVPRIATRADFKLEDYKGDKLEELKLDDAILVHEDVKADLKIYADSYNEELVKPFMLVIARDTDHSKDLFNRINSDDFHNGRYKGRVMKIDSKQTGAEKDENIELLLSLEKPQNDIEIVIHVNMLKEGWDVTNLYTILPLRKAKSDTLVKQSIGRGLRLPYGKPTGVDSVDCLNVIAHENFEKIIEATKKIFTACKQLNIGEIKKPRQSLDIKPNLEQIITEVSSDIEKELVPVFLEVIKEMEDVPTTQDLDNKNNAQEIVTRIRTKTQGSIDTARLRSVTKKMTEAYIQHTINIPIVKREFKDGERYTFAPFTLDISKINNLKSVAQRILLERIDSKPRHYLASGNSAIEGNPKDFIVFALREYYEISYDDHTSIVNNLVEQAIDCFYSYLVDETEVRNVAYYHSDDVAREIHAQMMQHQKSGVIGSEQYEAEGFERLLPLHVNYHADEVPRHFSNKVRKGENILGMVFIGFSKCLYTHQKFDSEPERAFAELLENEPEVLKWCKPSPRNLKIFYSNEKGYEPDFVVETDTDKWLCEVKANNKKGDLDVVAKADAAKEWCKTAREYEKKHGGKAWNYALIWDDKIKPSATFRGLLKSSG